MVLYYYQRGLEGKWDFVEYKARLPTTYFKVKDITYILMPIYYPTKEKPSEGICVYNVIPVLTRDNDFCIRLIKPLEDDKPFTANIHTGGLDYTHTLKDNSNADDIIRFTKEMINLHCSSCVVS